MHRRFAVAIATGLAAALMAVPALAGGWAVTTLDALSENMQAGETYSVGYTIRQHGERPFPGATPTIRIMRGDQMLVFKGMPDGQPGHYVSKVQFPSDGEWTWVVDQTPFATQQLGAITIAAVPPPAAAPSPSLEAKPTEPSWAGIGASLALAAALAVLLSGRLPFPRRATALR
jgi:hypothetical protein